MIIFFSTLVYVHLTQKYFNSDDILMETLVVDTFWKEMNRVQHCKLKFNENNHYSLSYYYLVPRFRLHFGGAYFRKFSLMNCLFEFFHFKARPNMSHKQRVSSFLKKASTFIKFSWKVGWRRSNSVRCVGVGTSHSNIGL